MGMLDAIFASIFTIYLSPLIIFIHLHARFVHEVIFLISSASKLLSVELPISSRLAISLFNKSVKLIRNLMCSFPISHIFLNLVLPFISSSSISVISSIICELVKPDPNSPPIIWNISTFKVLI